MDNPEYYKKAYAATQNASGAMGQMQEDYMQGIEGRMNTLQSAGEQIVSTLFNQDDLEPIIGGATQLLNVINDIIDSVGGGLPVFTALSAVLLKTFNTQVAGQVAQIATNIQTSAQAAKNAGLMDESLGILQNAKEKKQEDTGAITQIRGVLQGKEFANLSEGTQEKILESSRALLDADSKVAEVKEQQKLIQDQINMDLANSSELADVILAEEKAVYEIGQQRLQEEKDRFEIEAAGGEYTDEEIAEKEAELRIIEQEVEADRKRYENTKATLDINGQLSSFTVEELVALDKKNAELGEATNYAERYLKLMQEADSVRGEYQAAEGNLAGIGDQANVERISASITNLVSGLTSVVFLAQAGVSLWQTWTDEGTSFEDKVIASISSLAMTLPLLITTISSLVSVKWADVAAGAAMVTENIANAASTAGLAAASGTLTVALLAEKIGLQGLSNAFLTLAVSMETTPIGWIAGAIAGVVAVVGLGIIAFNNWQDSIHAASKNFEEQNALLTETRNNYKDIDEEVSNLKSSMDSLSEAQSNVDSLTRYY